MTKKLFTISVFLIIAGAALFVYAGFTMQYFTAKANSDGILIEWKTADEAGSPYFELERSASTTENFIYIKSISTTGNNSYYSYEDNSLNNKLGNSSIYYYRLKIYKPDGNFFYSGNVSVVYTVSGIKDTWGSIKAIFR